MDDAQVIVTLIGLVCMAIGIVIAWVIPCLVCATAAHRKGLNYLWFFILSFFFTPIIGFLAVIAMQPLPPSDKE